MAYTGAQSEDDRAIIKETYITFPPAGHHIQRTEIALASLGIVLHIVLPTYSSVRIEPLRKVFSLSEAKKGRISLLKYPVAYSLVATAAWAVCIAFQSDYVPILGTNKLPECVEFGDELSQCGMLTASWILAMIYW
ncbi:hypothetical protein B0I35DRAFT_475881 [Stachybotrys elegans]|uniref:Uncharacterized protein n=1 Tax=Stachybotrys elegans TaxID=80388 RepID=A0A8K0SXK7_9HYPO|nr:hypothetical protein B0I35DRAFT_475881 [Stachybotrys elegans]